MRYNEAHSHEKKQRLKNNTSIQAMVCNNIENTNDCSDKNNIRKYFMHSKEASEGSEKSG
jgi:hypothetical protein